MSVALNTLITGCANGHSYFDHDSVGNDLGMGVSSWCHSSGADESFRTEPVY